MKKYTKYTYPCTFWDSLSVIQCVLVTNYVIEVIIGLRQAYLNSNWESTKERKKEKLSSIIIKILKCIDNLL